MVDRTNLFDLMELYLNDCQLRKLTPRTLDSYRKILHPMLLWLDGNGQLKSVSDLVPQHFQMFFPYREKNGVSPEYTNDISRAMRTLCRFMYNEGYRVRGKNMIFRTNHPRLFSGFLSRFRRKKTLKKNPSGSHLVSFQHFYILRFRPTKSSFQILHHCLFFRQCAGGFVQAHKYAQAFRLYSR